MHLALDIAIPVDRPRGKGRPRLGRGGRVYTPTATRDAERHMADAIRAVWKRPPLTGAVYVELEYRFPRPKSGPNATAAHHTCKPDRDNLDKLTLDALTIAGVWVDDCQACSGRSSKVWIPREARASVLIRVYSIV